MVVLKMNHEFIFEFISLILFIIGTLFLCPIPAYLNVSFIGFSYCFCAATILMFIGIVGTLLNPYSHP
jgi:hypothetical protein